jgi:uncharacterized membrane protein
LITPPAVIHLGPLRSFLARGLLILAEVVVVPGLLLYAFVTVGHPMLGLVAVFMWRIAWISSRLGKRVRVPMTCWFAFALFLSRTVAGLALDSVSLYLFVPITLCAVQGIAFLGSAASRRPLMMRLASDYTAALPQHPALRGLFAQISAIWGVVHLACAALGLWALTLATGQAVAVTGGLGLVCTVSSVGGCLGWALWRTRRIAGLRIAFRAPGRPAALPVPSAVPATELAPAA